MEKVQALATHKETNVLSLDRSSCFSGLLKIFIPCSPITSKAQERFFIVMKAASVGFAAFVAFDHSVAPS